MKLCHVVPSLEVRHGGPSKSVRRLALALADLGHEVDLFATSARAADVGETQVGRLDIRIFPRGRPQLFCPSAGLRAGLVQQQDECVHAHGLWLRPLHYAHRHALATGARFVISPRGMLTPWAHGHHRLRKWLAGKLVHPGALRAAHGWHATSESEANDLRRLGFRQPICVAPNSIDAPTGDEVAHARTVWTRLCPETARRPVALFYSRFHRKKRVRELMELWAARAPRDWLLIVAGLPQEYSVAELQAETHRLSAEDRIRIFSGADRPPPYPVAALFLLPSHSENHGQVVAEALAFGVPALVTTTTPWQEMAAAGAGWCVPWEDYPATLAAACREGTENLRARGAGARDWVLQRYSWEKSAAHLAEFYGDLSRTKPC